MEKLIEEQKVLDTETGTGLEEIPEEIWMQEEKDQIAKEPYYRVTKRFDLLDSGQDEKLAAQIVESRGVLRIFVHPFHRSDAQAKYGDKEAPFDYTEYMPSKILYSTMNSPDMIPALILEDEAELEKTRLSLEMGESRYPKRTKDRLYILPTIKNASFIKLRNFKEPIRYFEDRRNPNFDEYGRQGMYALLKSLDKLKVEKILLAGSELEVDENGLQRCVGTFINDFKAIDSYMKNSKGYKPISLQVSVGTSSDGRNELRSAGYLDLL
ncbi:MAG: hypothetical protein JWP09_186 [Candidatus Taylorbacteria bacterium]|nr:hypothetical protein [Candidatus Taylorbacteria bacterium]